MREIKFRAWDKSGEYMVEPFRIQNIGAVLNWKDLELMQYTGLKDRNGKEVYEGDIVGVDEAVCEVIWGSCCFMIRWPSTPTEEEVVERLSNLLYTFGFEVIGNIYENPELVKEVKPNSSQS